MAVAALIMATGALSVAIINGRVPVFEIVVSCIPFHRLLTAILLMHRKGERSVNLKASYIYILLKFFKAHYPIEYLKKGLLLL